MNDFTEKSLDNHFGRYSRKKQGFSEAFREKLRNYNYRRFFVNRVPIIRVLYNYDIRNSLLYDLLAGISVGLSTIPQAMGYALMLRIPVEYGLYSIIFPSLIYSVLTASIHASCTINIGGTIFVTDALQSLGYNDDLGQNSSDVGEGELTPEMEDRLHAIFSLTFISGIALLIFTLLKFSVLVRFNSEPHMSAVFASSTIVIIVNQLAPMLGVVPDTYAGFLQTIKLFINICELIPETNVASAIISVISLVLIIFVKEVINVRYEKHLPVPIPIEMIVLLASTLISSLWDWENTFDVQVVGYVPAGLPTPQFPLKSDWTDFVREGVLIAILTMLGVPILIKFFSVRHDYPVNMDQEFFAMGTATLISPTMSCGAIGMSSPRCLIMESCGGRTQVAYIFAGLTSLTVVMFLADYADSLPKCVVSAIIVSSFARVFSSFGRIRKYWRRDKIFFMLWWFTFIASLVITVSDGIMYGLGFSILVTALRTLFTDVSVKDIGYYKNKPYLLTSNKYERCSPYPRVKILSIAGAVFYGNALELKDGILKMFPRNRDIASVKITNKGLDRKASIALSYINENFIHDEYSHRDSENIINPSLENDANDTADGTADISVVILDFSGVPFIDTSALRELVSLKCQLEDKHQCQLRIANCCESVRRYIQRAPAVLNKLQFSIYMTVEDILTSHNIRTWEEQSGMPQKDRLSVISSCDEGSLDDDVDTDTDDECLTTL